MPSSLEIHSLLSWVGHWAPDARFLLSEEHSPVTSSLLARKSFLNLRQHKSQHDVINMKSALIFASLMLNMILHPMFLPYLAALLVLKVSVCLTFTGEVSFLTYLKMRKMAFSPTGPPRTAPMSRKLLFGSYFYLILKKKLEHFICHSPKFQTRFSVFTHPILTVSHQNKNNFNNKF